MATQNAGLFGNDADITQAGSQTAGGIAQQLRAVQSYLARGNLTLEEQLRLQAQIVELKQRELVTVTETARQAQDQRIAVAAGQTDIASTGLSRSYLLGAGGPGSYGAASNIANLSAASRREAENKVALLRSQGVDENNMAMIDARRQLEGAKYAESQSIVSLGNIPQPLALTQGQRRGEFTLGMLTRTYASFGDIRGTIGGLMNNAGEQMKNLRAEEAKAEREGRFNGPEGAALRAQFENRRMEVGNQLIGYQQELESGWQDRLVSQVYNQPGSFNFVASQFTRAESAKFMGAMSPAFGFTDPKDRDRFMFRGPRLASSIIGNISRPEGFTETAMSGAMMPGAMGEMGGAGANPVITIKVINVDGAGKVLGQGSASATLHDLLNGAADLSVNRHAAATPRT